MARKPKVKKPKPFRLEPAVEAEIEESWRKRAVDEPSGRGYPSSVRISEYGRMPGDYDLSDSQPIIRAVHVF